MKWVWLAIILVVPIVTAQLAVVSEEELDSIVKTVDPSNLGIQNVSANNIEVRVMGTESVFRNRTTSDSLKKVVKKVEGESYEVFLQMMTDVINNSRHTVFAQKSLKVYQVTPIYANVDRTDYVTRKKISVNANSSVEVIEVLSVQNASVITFVDDEPVVLSENPVVLYWNSTGVVNSTYFVNDLLVGDDGRGLYAVAEGPGSSDISNADERKISLKSGEEAQAQKNEEDIKREGVVNSLVKLSIIFLVLLVLGIFIVELEGRDSLEGIKNIGRDAEVIYRIGFKNRAMLDSYISECIQKGYHLQDIKIGLNRAGWDKAAVRALLKKYK